MAKKPIAQIKLQCPAGQANPAPPVGPALGQHGLNIMEFCKKFNAATQKQAGMIIPCIITVYSDRSFSFILKTPPAAVLLLKEAGLKKGSGTTGKDKCGKISLDKVRKIAEIKLPDLNCYDIDAAIETVKGTARSMGLEVTK